MLSESNIELESIKNDVKEQENLNESLKMQISELASLDTIQSVASYYASLERSASKAVSKFENMVKKAQQE